MLLLFAYGIKRFSHVMAQVVAQIMQTIKFTNSGLSLEGNLGEKVSPGLFTPPYFELREKLKCTEHIGKIQNLGQNSLNAAELLPV